MNQNSDQNDLEDWTLVDIIDLDSIQNISESIDNIHIDSDNSIVESDFYGSTVTLVENEIILQNSILIPKSYREALLYKPEIKNDPKLVKNENEQNNQIVTIRSIWKPTIIIEKIKNERKDRLYQHNISSQSMYTFEDEDEYGFQNYFKLLY